VPLLLILWNLLRHSVLALLALLLLYLAAAVLLGALATNRDYRPAPAGITIFLYSNGVHSALALPVHAAGIDWTRVFAPQQLRAGALAPQWDYLLIGWGERRFYLETPTWGDLKARTALLALSGLNRGALHVQYLPAPAPGPVTLPLTLSPAAYARLAAFVHASVPLDQRGAARWIAGYHYTYNDAFYEAHGRFSLFNTCNQWTRNALAAAGVRVPLWAPFATALFWQLR
jgi:uncharacterized protein (TIGR02117 family)